jgi:hypothetical protein
MEVGSDPGANQQALTSMFALLLETRHGWTDNIGHNAPANANQWPTEAAAMAAAAELDQAWGTTSQWRVVDEDRLSSYDLVA